MKLKYDQPKGAFEKILSDPNYESYTEPIELCRCCGSAKFKQLEEYRKNVHLLRCEQCGAITFSRILKSELLSQCYNDKDYYASFQKQGSSEVTFSEIDRIVKRIANPIMKEHFLNRGHISILDFSGGSGEITVKLAEYLIQSGACSTAEILVVDYNSNLYQNHGSNITISHAFPLESVKKQFDLVIASAIIEHIPEAGKTVRELFTLTKTDGYLYFRTPYMYPTYHFLKRFGFSLNLLYPEHIWDFSEEWWEHAAENCGYEQNDIQILLSRPSIVCKSLRYEFLGAMAAYLLKALWYLCHKWNLVGGWEIYFKKVKNE